MPIVGSAQIGQFSASGPARVEAGAGAGKACIAMAFDAAMFEHARPCIEALGAQVRPAAACRLIVYDVGLSAEQVAWLEGAGAQVCRDPSLAPAIPGGPPYAKALTCRPLLRDIFPGFDLYLWLDADIRLMAPEALKTFLDAAAANPDKIVLAQEVDSSYLFVRDPVVSRNYHAAFRQRLAEVYDAETVSAFETFIGFNAGIFAMHRDCPVWEKYRENVDRAFRTPFQHMKEQDALNVAIHQTGMRTVNLGARFNWICSASIPVFSKEARCWVRPAFPHDPISVLHLAGSGQKVKVNGMFVTWHAYYKMAGMTT